VIDVWIIDHRSSGGDGVQQLLFCEIAADKLFKVAARARGRSKALQTEVGESVLNGFATAKAL
jgi:hypothetical protein